MNHDFFGKFNVERWEADEFVITCKAGPIGFTIGKNAAHWLPDWLNSAIPEAIKKISEASCNQKTS